MLEVPFLTVFCTSFWKRVHSSQGIVNLQGLFVLIVGYVDMTRYPPTKYYYVIKRAYFIYKFFIFYFLSVHFPSYCFYMQYHGAIREITSMLV